MFVTLLGRQRELQVRWHVLYWFAKRQGGLLLIDRDEVQFMMFTPRSPENPLFNT